MHTEASRTWKALFAYGLALAAVTLLILPATRSTAPAHAAFRSGTETAAAALVQLSAATDTPSGVSVTDSRVLRMQVGEVQSTVVPPATVANCPNGRLLISNDRSKEPAQVALIDLGNLDASPGSATFDTPPGWQADRRIMSNDHDIVALPNGQVLLVKMGQSKRRLDPMPNWFGHTYKLSINKDGILKASWGPGARSEILIWRSEDCGSTFHYLSAIDTALIDDDYGTPDDGSAALPQYPAWTTGPGTMAQPAFQMGGTDGILTRVDPATGRVYITVGLVGVKPLALGRGFSLGAADKDGLNRTVVMMSSDSGANWDRAALFHRRTWRLDVVPRAGDMLAFGHSNGKDSKTNVGSAYVIPACSLGCVVTDTGPDAFAAPVTPAHWGWDTTPDSHPVLYMGDPGLGDYMGVGLFDRAALTRSPNSQDLLFAYTDTVEGKGDGYRLFLYDGLGSWQPLDPIVPEFPDPGNYTMHVTPVDPGRGPIFFYWYDVDTATERVTIRGKLVTRDDEETEPFPVSRGRGAKRSFDVSAALRWYGDYHTAGGYATESGTVKTYNYYPVWLESDARVRFARVTYDMPITRPTTGWFGHRLLLPGDRLFLQEPVDLSAMDRDWVEPEAAVIRKK